MSPRGPSAERRRAYRREVKARGGSGDRFSDTMAALLGGGSRACACCTLIRPTREMVEGVCVACQGSLGRMRKAPAVAISLQPGALEVFVDASFRDGVAGLAITGSLGEHTRQIQAVSSTQAEVLALRWAMILAGRKRLRDVQFYTDCQAAHRVLGHWGARLGWVITQIPRQRNGRADVLASRARLEMTWMRADHGPVEEKRK